MRKKGLMKYKAQLSIFTLVLFCLTLLPLNAIKVKATEVLKSPVINADGTVTFSYQGDGTETIVKVKGEFSNWATVDMVEGQNNVWSATVIGKPGISEYGIVSWSPTTKDLDNGDWKADPLNTNKKNGNPALVMNPEIVGENVTLYYLGDGTETIVKVKGEFSDWKTTDMTKGENSNIWSVQLKVSPGTYQYGIVSWSPTTKDLDNGDWKGDPLNPKASGNSTFYITGLYKIDGADNVEIGKTTQLIAKNLLPDGKDEAATGIVWSIDKVDVAEISTDGLLTVKVKEIPTGEKNVPVVITAKLGKVEVSKTINIVSKVPNYGPKKVVLVGSIQKPISGEEWKPESDKTRMEMIGQELYAITTNLPKGDYEFKIAVGGSWDENYGVGNYTNPNKEGTDNIKISIAEQQEVTFYYSDKTHLIADSTYYKEVYEDAKRPRLAGTIQKAMGEAADWEPGQSTLLLYDHNFNGIYSIDLANVPKGNYEYKVTVGPKWDVSYGDGKGNCKIVFPDKGDATITFDSNTKEITSKVSASVEGEFDGQVNGKKLYHNTWDTIYRYPFGAVAEGTDVTLRLRAQKGDLQYARVLVRNRNNNKSDLYNMQKVATTTIEDGTAVDIWEATVKPDAMGVCEYKFIAGDGDTVKYYGDDGNEGKTGAEGDNNSLFFQLTVYDKDYKTPDWMKEAVVYQIFPDRFFDGDKTNNDAKENARGDEPIERPVSWDTLPDNPRLGEKNMNDLNGPYSGDAIWSNDFYGGDIKGVQAKLDYLQGLGINTIYLNPISMAASNHKYDATDYKKLDPMFGSEKDFKNFTAELEKRGMKLIVDGVFNHVGDESVYFDRYGKYDTVGAYEYWAYVYDSMNVDSKLTEKDAMKKADKYFVDKGQVFSKEKWHLWFNIKNQKVNVGTTKERYDYQAWWGFESLPEFKSMEEDEAIALGLADDSDEFVSKDSEWNNKALVDYIYKADDSVAKQWIDWGADGWRLDVANEVDTIFWNEFREEMKAHNSDTLILGEIWDDASKYFIGDQYDSVMNYRIRGALISYLKTNDATKLNDTLMAVYEDYPKEAFYALMNLMGSHDTARAKYILGNGSDTSERAEMDSKYNEVLGEQRLMLAALFEFGYPGAPTVYYGDEAGVIGSKDPDCRRTYPWGKEDKELVSYYSSLGKIREANKDLFAHGDLNTLYTGEEGVYVYGRSYNGETALVAINPTDEDKTVTFKINSFTGNTTEYKDQLVSNYEAQVANGEITITIPKMTGRIMTSTTSIKLPSAVDGIIATEGNGEVTLTWNAVEGAEEYKVYTSSFKGSNTIEVVTVKDANATIKDLVNGEKLYIAVAVVDGNGNISPFAWSEGVVPHSIIGWCGNLSGITVDKVDISTPIEVTAEVYSDGATNGEGVAPGINGRLLVKYPGDDNFTVVKATYTGEARNNDLFKATFVPTKEGEYEYKFEFTTRGVNGFADGIDNKSTESKIVTLAKGDDVVAADSITLEKPEQQSGEVNLKWSVAGTNNIALFEIVRDGKVVARINDSTATSYRDIDVRNKVSYKYEVIAYTNGGNAVKSNEVEVTPDLVMVEVTFKLKAPAYTPLDAKVTMPGEMNGWSTGAWEMSRNGAVTTDWTYTVSVLEGETIEYKYVKGGDWDQEGLMKYTNPNAAKQSAYGCTTGEGGNEKITVENQGDGKMVVSNEVIRWKDMPVVILDPMTGSVTKNESIIIKGNAMLDPNLTINGEKVVVDENGNFAHETKLTLGKNEIKIHIEPTEENKNNPDIFNNNAEALGFATKDLVLEVTRELIVQEENGVKVPVKVPVIEGKVDLGSAILQQLLDNGIGINIGSNTGDISIGLEVLKLFKGTGIALDVKEVNSDVINTFVKPGISALGSISIQAGDISKLENGKIAVKVRINPTRTRTITRTNTIPAYVYLIQGEALKLISITEVKEGFVNFETDTLGQILITDKVINQDNGNSGGGIVTPPTNTAPSISAKDITLKVGEVFNPFTGVTATDKEDGDLTSKIKVVQNAVDINKVGEYKVVYEVTDSNGKTTSKEIKVEVTKLPNKVPVITASDVTIKRGEIFKPLTGVFAKDDEEGDITSKVNIIINTVDKSKEGKYRVVYEVVDNDGANATKEITVTVSGELTLEEVHVNAYEATLSAIEDKTQSSINEARAYISELKSQNPNNPDISTWSAMLDKVQLPIYIDIVNRIVELNEKLAKGEGITQKEVNELRILLENNIQDPTDNIPEEYLVKCGWSEYTDMFQMDIVNKIVKAVVKAEIYRTVSTVEAARTIINDMMTSVKPDMVKWAKTMEARLNKVVVK